MKTPNDTESPTTPTPSGAELDCPAVTGSQYGAKIVLNHDEVLDALDELSWVAEAFRKRRESKLSVNALRAALIMCAEDVVMRAQLEKDTAISPANA